MFNFNMILLEVKYLKPAISYLPSFRQMIYSPWKKDILYGLLPWSLVSLPYRMSLWVLEWDSAVGCLEVTICGHHFNFSTAGTAIGRRKLRRYMNWNVVILLFLKNISIESILAGSMIALISSGALNVFSSLCKILWAVVLFCFFAWIQYIINLLLGGNRCVTHHLSLNLEKGQQPHSSIVFYFMKILVTFLLCWCNILMCVSIMIFFIWITIGLYCRVFLCGSPFGSSE